MIADVRTRVLVIDDEEQVRATIADALSLEGYEVAQAKDGADGLALLRTLRPDVILLDLSMPLMDGWEFRKAQVIAHPGIPVVVLSAFEISHQRFAELHADGLLAKPFDLDDLYAAVAKAVGPSR